MNTKEIISSGLLESYVLGTATSEEIVLIQTACKNNPELLHEIELIEASLIQLAERSAEPMKRDIKNKIASQLVFKEEKTEGAKIVPLVAKDGNKLSLYKFGMAASLLLFVTSLMYNVLLQQKLTKVNGDLAELNAAKSYMADEMKIQKATLQTINSELQIVANPMVKTIALKGMNSLDKKSAMIHWNTETSEVYFNAADLPNSPESKQFQLWAIVDGKPVDAGMIDLAGSSIFQKMKSIKGATAFAVTIENKGGSAVPSMETMCLLGNV